LEKIGELWTWPYSWYHWIVSKMSNTSFNDQTTEAQLLRLGEAMVDANIEGLDRDPEGEALLRKMVEEGLSGPERRARLKAYLQSKVSHSLAAE
jgi:hypothetical protein